MIRFLIKCRDFLINIFGHTIIGIVDEKQFLIYNNKILYFIPFIFGDFIIKLFNYEYYYIKDDIYYYSKNQHLSITPPIINLNIDNDNINFKDTLTLYQPNFPLWIILFNEKLFINYLKITILKDGILQNLKFNYNDIYKLSIHDILQK